MTANEDRVDRALQEEYDAFMFRVLGVHASRKALLRWK